VRFELVTVTSRATGTQTTARLAFCEDCDGETFVCYQIAGQEGYHLQCVTCATTYCLGHECSLPGSQT
jgi:hypothetical protein